HEHEALGGGSVRRLYCRLTSFSRSLQIILRINLDGTPTYADNSCHPFMAIQHSFKKSGPYPTFG
ncbi:hypothetical protein ACTQ34_17550, partial [Agathobaculum sp. LCP25S3_E8]|uniref:hypothetical protein n=1 Tax=Agathobaculum sp. LCP25S3_E8 TaxID=3438735 RepID=UPI003F8F8D1E